MDTESILFPKFKDTLGILYVFLFLELDVTRGGENVNDIEAIVIIMSQAILNYYIEAVFSGA